MKKVLEVPDGAFRVGKRVALRPLNKADAPLLYKWINDPEVHQFLKVKTPLSLQEEEKWIENLAGNKPNQVVFGIMLLGSGKLIGNMGLHRINFVDGTAVTGSIIGDKQYWNQGLGTEAKTLLLEYAFNTLGLRKVCASVYDFNGRSKRCMEKCGYHQEGVRKQHIFRNGRYVDEILMAVFKEDFLKVWEVFQKKSSSKK